MYILGISAFYHDSAACLIRNGDIVAAAQVERFSRQKHDAGFPCEAIKYCLKQAKINATEIENYYSNYLNQNFEYARDIIDELYSVNAISEKLKEIYYELS